MRTRSAAPAVSSTKRASRNQAPPSHISAAAVTDGPGRSPQGGGATRGPPTAPGPYRAALPRRTARTGHRASSEKPTATTTPWANEPPLLGAGNRASSIAESPPPTSAALPNGAAGRSPHAVTTWQAPRATSADVITQYPAAPFAARTLIVVVAES